MSDKKLEERLAQVQAETQKVKDVAAPKLVSITFTRPPEQIYEKAFTVGMESPLGLCLEIKRVDGCWEVTTATKKFIVQGEATAIYHQPRNVPETSKK